MKTKVRISPDNYKIALGHRQNENHLDIAIGFFQGLSRQINGKKSGPYPVRFYGKSYLSSASSSSVSVTSVASATMG